MKHILGKVSYLSPIPTNEWISVVQTFPYYLTSFLYIINLYFTHVYKNSFTLVFLVYGILPIAENYISFDIKNPTKQEQKILRKQFRWKIPLYMSIVLDWISLVSLMKVILYTEGSYIFKIGILISIGTIQGSSINVSHEIIHKKDKFSQIIGTLNLTKNMYMHFFIEHLTGHHRNVATYTDPATSRKDETFYEFLPRTLIGSYTNAWKIENERCMYEYKTTRTWKNKMYFFTLCHFLVPLFIYTIGGFKAMLLHLLIAFLSITGLEIVNYLEHYGLLRKKLDNGEYEIVNVTHSWNAPHRLTNYFLFKLQRHSDHHENSRKPYQTLCSYEKSPTLPFGYSAGCILALFPPWWFNIMNPVLESYKKTQKPPEELSRETNSKIVKFLFWINILLITLLMIQ
jgi:alkane 1-monooxygenase